MRALLKFMTLKQFKTAGFWLGISFPLVIMGLFSNFMGPLSIQYAAASIAIGITIAVMLGWGKVFSSIKTSSLMKSIQTSNIRKRDFFILSFVASLIMFTIVSVILIGTFMIFITVGVVDIMKPYTISPKLSLDQTVNPADYLYHLNWGLLVGALLNIWVTASALTFFMTSISKNDTMYQTMSWSYVILALLFTGMIIPPYLLRAPIDALGQSNQIIEQTFISISWFMPTSYTNFYLVDIMQMPAYEAIGTNMEINSFLFNQNWIVPFIYNSFFGAFGLYWVRHWN